MSKNVEKAGGFVINPHLSLESDRLSTNLSLKKGFEVCKVLADALPPVKTHVVICSYPLKHLSHHVRHAFLT